MGITKHVKSMLVALVAIGLLVVAFAFPCAAFAETYAHGYLRYEVADQSVTITGYAGSEETVTVPAMIGGNPVNTIAAGAFADARTVKAVYLPDTVTSVEQGAFGVGQAVVFGGRAENSSGSSSGGSTDDLSDKSSGDSSDDSSDNSAGKSSDDAGSVGSGETAAPSQSASSGAENGAGGDEATGSSNSSPADGSGQTASSSGGGAALGISAGESMLVTVDDEGHLVLVGPSGIERVLDDSRSYTRQKRSDGTISIVNDAGDEVAVADGSKVSFSDAEGRQVVVDAARGTTTTTSTNGSQAYEEAEIDADADAEGGVDDVDGAVADGAGAGDDESAKASSANPSESFKTADEQQEKGGVSLAPVLVGIVAVIAIVAGGIVFWKRRKQ